MEQNNHSKRLLYFLLNSTVIGPSSWHKYDETLLDVGHYTVIGIAIWMYGCETKTPAFFFGLPILTGNAHLFPWN